VADLSLPHTFRPRWARRVCYPVAVVVVVLLTAIALTLPERFRSADRFGIIAVGLLIAYGLHRLAAVRIKADENGLTVVNVVRRRRLEWAEVIAVRLNPADPWLTLDLSDGTEMAAMGIQGSDRAYARDQALALARLVVAHSRTERND
jgi:hypothetical protein